MPDQQPVVTPQVPSPQLIRCISCGNVMVRDEEASRYTPDNSACLEFYRCAACGRMLALYWELTNKPTNEQISYVEREIQRRGSFFPQDYSPGRFNKL